jgi:hypothetical protein
VGGPGGLATGLVGASAVPEVEGGLEREAEDGCAMLEAEGVASSAAEGGGRRAGWRRG